MDHWCFTKMLKLLPVLLTQGAKGGFTVELECIRAVPQAVPLVDVRPRDTCTEGKRAS